MGLKLQLTYDEIIDLLDVKHITESTRGYTLTLGNYKVTDDSMMLKSLLPKDVKVKTTNDVFRLN